MSDLGPNDRLHLPSLSITGFRGIDNLVIRRLGRVTLLAGTNGIGKTTVLEACRVFASRGRYTVLTELARGHEEYSAATDEDGDKISGPDLTALFHGRDVSQNARIEIGLDRLENYNCLVIELVHPNGEQLRRQESLFDDDIAVADFRVLKTVFQDREHVIPWTFALDLDERGLRDAKTMRMYRRKQRLLSQDELPPAIECVSLGPGLMRNEEVATFWDRVALTDDEAHAVEALQLVLGNEVERVAMVGDDVPRYRGYRRRAVVKLRGLDRPVPLKSLGDGATRLFSVALALANCRNGFLLIDEAENGIHYSIHREFWRLVLRTAQRNNVQVLATTHGWDCIQGFAQSATEDDRSEGILVRLERNDKEVRSTEYSEMELKTAAEQGIEVR